MSGLILSALGQGISQAGGTVGSAMTRGYEREQDEARRMRERQEDADLRRELAGVRGGGTGGTRSSGGRVAADEPELNEGTTEEERAAAAMGMSVPQFRQFRSAQQTGDFSAFEQPMEGSETGTVLPTGFIEQQRKKWATFLTERATAKSYNDLTTGQRNVQEIDATATVLKDPTKGGVVAKAIAAGEGKDQVGISGNTKYDKFTGESSTTEVGESVIDKNKRPPAGKGGGGGGRAPVDTSRIRTLSDYTQRERTIRSQIGRAFGPEKEKLQKELESLLADRKAFEGGGAAPKRGDNGTINKDEVRKFWK